MQSGKHTRNKGGFSQNHTDRIHILNLEKKSHSRIINLYRHKNLHSSHHHWSNDVRMTNSVNDLKEKGQSGYISYFYNTQNIGTFRRSFVICNSENDRTNGYCS